MKYGIYPISKAFSVDNDCKDAEVLCECEELDIGEVIEYKGKRYVVCFTTNFNFSGIKEINPKDNGDSVVYSDDMFECPFCGYQNPESFEHKDSEDEHECGMCSSVFAFDREVRVSYTTKLVKPPKLVRVPER
jgi:hypothetical protein